jgi:hypothetical protein
MFVTDILGMINYCYETLQDISCMGYESAKALKI